MRKTPLGWILDKSGGAIVGDYAKYAWGGAVSGIPSSPGLANPNQGIAVFPSVESVQELKVQTNAYSAEFGRSGSGIINLIYKSGTNHFHGSLFEFLRNSNLDANSYYSNLNGVPLPNFKRNQFGASLGGPVDLPRLYK